MPRVEVFRNRLGKTVPAEEKRNLPKNGEPDTTSLKWKNGKIDQGRTYDKNGNPYYDYDLNDKRNPNIPQRHTPPCIT